MWLLQQQRLSKQLKKLLRQYLSVKQRQTPSSRSWYCCSALKLFFACLAVCESLQWSVITREL